MAAVVLLWGIHKRQFRFALWLSSLAVGHVLILKAVQAGPLVRYQHYHTPGQPVWSANPVFVVWLLLQMTALVLVRARLIAAARWLKHEIGIWRTSAVAAIVFLTSAAVQANATYYATDLLVSAAVQLVSIGTIVIIASHCPPAVLDAIARRFPADDRGNVEPRAGTSIDRFAAAAALAVVAAASILNLTVYQNHPHITDEAAYVFHARMLAAGTMSTAAPPVPEAFTFYLIDVAGDRLYSVMPSVWPMLLAVGMKLGVPWLVNPMLAALNILLTYWLVEGLYDRRTARLVVTLLAVSPWYVFMAMNFMTHTATLTCALGATLALSRAARTRQMSWVLLAGGLTGLASLIRPLDGLIVAIFQGACALWFVTRRQLTPAALGLLMAGTASVALLILPYNAALTGSSAAMPVNEYMARYFGGGSNDYGFGADRGFGWPVDPNRGHSVTDALINLNLNAFSVNVELLGWSTGSVLLGAFVMFSRRAGRQDYIMALACLLVIAAYFPYYYGGGPDFGARYWYLMIIPCMVLTARGVLLLLQGVASPATRQRVMFAVVVLATLAVVNFFPWRALDKYWHSWGMRPDIRAMSSDMNFGRSLVLVRGANHPDYVSAAVYNPLDFHADAPIYAWDRDADVRRRLLTAYSDRHVWILNGPTITGRGYEVAEGPVPARVLLNRQ